MNSTEMRKTPDSLESYKSTNPNKSNIFHYIEVFFHPFKFIHFLSNDITNFYTL